MAVATVAVTSGRVAPLQSVTAIQLTVTFSSTAYATASGGVSFDIANALNNALGDLENGINPSDILAVQPTFLSSSFFLATAFTVGTPTYTTNTDASSARSQNVALATCPCTIRFYGTGSGNQAALAEIANGNITDVVKLTLLIARGGGGL